MRNDFSLFKTPRFLPLFITQFLGAMNDNLFKNALAIFLAFGLTAQAGLSSELLINLATALFVLPFFLFSATAGQLADKFERSRLIQVVKLGEVILAVVISYAFLNHYLSLLFFALFLLGAQATFFGPLKYAILPDHLAENELVAGNSFIEAATYLAILLGTLIGGLLISYGHGIGLVCSIFTLVSLIGLASSFYIPKAAAPAPQLKLNWNVWTETQAIIVSAFQQWSIYITIMGISWFWLIGTVYLTNLGLFAKNILHANEHVVTLFVTLFAIGIGIGSILSNALLKGRIQATFVPLAAICLSLFSLDLVFSSEHFTSKLSTYMLTPWQFLSHGHNWRILLDLTLIAISGGVFIVPLYVILQHESPEEQRARNIAANNIINALFMVVGVLISGLLLKLGLSTSGLFLILAVLNLGVAVYVCKLLPDALVKSFVKWLLTVLYRVEVKGLEHYQAAGDKVVIVANHASFLDAALLSAFLPDRLTFAVNTYIAREWWLKLLLHFIDAFPVDPANPLSLKSLIHHVGAGKRCVIFPEGRITTTGALMKVYEGPGLVADRSGSTILPIRIEGAQYSPFSRLKGKTRIRWFPKISLTIFPASSCDVPNELKGRNRRRFIGHHLYDLMINMVFASSPHQQTLTEALLDAVSVHGRKRAMVEDIERKPMTYQQLVMRCLILGRYIAKRTQPNEHVGILLPNSIAFTAMFFGLHFFSRIPAILNFSTGTRNVSIACETAEIKQVYTSRRFVEMGKLEDMVQAIQAKGVEVIFLEDLKGQIGLLQKLTGLFGAFFARSIFQRNLPHKAACGDPNTPAVILFTSGSEGAPKGVVLSHKNILANCYQMTSCVDFTAQDSAFNALPVFHSFGLTAGFVLPLINGLKVFLYPSPLHYRIVPELVYDMNATIFFGTDTFLTGYAKYAHPYDFYSVRYLFAGAEKLKESTRRLWAERFGVTIYEGYGATEASPVISTNTPMQNKVGTVGRLLPGIEYQKQFVEGVHNGFRLWIKGPNVMLGYLKADQPGQLQPLEQDWYDTGDIVDIDEDGFVSILGRAKRFAKIGGEMVSLTAVEHFVQNLSPEYAHAAVSIPDGRKGEQIVLFTTQTDLSREKLVEASRAQGLAEIGLPKQILVLETMLTLGSGKVDYLGLQALAESKVSAGASNGVVSEEKN